MPNIHRSALKETPSSRESARLAPAQPRFSGESWLEDEVDFQRHRRVLRRHWKRLVAGLLIGATAGLMLALRRPLVYEAATTMIVEQTNSPAAISTSRALLQNYTLATETINETGLNRPPYNATPQGFVDNILQIEEVRGTNLVRIKVRLRDPALAAQVSRVLSRRALELNRRIASQGNTGVRAQLKIHLDEALARLQVTEQQLLAYQSEAQLDVQQTDADARLSQRGDLARLVINVEAEKARLAAAEREIQSHEPLLAVRRSVGSEAALRRAAGSAALADQPSTSGPASQRRDRPSTSARTDRPATSEPAHRPATSDLGDRSATSELANRPSASELVDPELLDLSNPMANPVYQVLAFQIAMSRTRLAGLERQRREMVDVRKVGAHRVTGLTDLYRSQLSLARLQDDYDIAKKVYADLVLRYEKSRAESADNLVQLQIVDEAIPPDRTIPRRRAESSALGGLAGLLLAGLAALVLGRDPQGDRPTRPADSPAGMPSNQL